MKSISLKLVTATVLASCIVVTASGQMTTVQSKRSYLIPSNHLKRVGLLSIAKQQNSLLSLVQMTTEEAEVFSQQLHNDRKACGGMMDVTNSVAKFGDQRVLDVASKTPVRLTTFDKTELTNPAQAALLISKTNKARFWSFLTKLASFPDRSATTESGVTAAKFLAAYAQQVATSANRTVEISLIPTGRGYIQPTTVIRVPGADPKLPAIIMGGHMDTFAKDVFGGERPGADDDASGSASVMEVYESAMLSGLKFKRDIYFMFYAAEERGLVGSDVVAEKLTKAGFKFRAAMQFDMTGFKSPKDNKEIYMTMDYIDTGLTALVEKMIISYLNIPAEKIGHLVCEYACSDHASWHKYGVPAVFPFESTFENHNKTLHTANDKMELLDPEHAYKYVKLGAAYLAEVADPL